MHYDSMLRRLSSLTVSEARRLREDPNSLPHINFTGPNGGKMKHYSVTAVASHITFYYDSAFQLVLDFSPTVNMMLQVSKEEPWEKPFELLATKARTLGFRVKITSGLNVSNIIHIESDVKGEDREDAIHYIQAIESFFPDLATSIFKDLYIPSGESAYERFIECYHIAKKAYLSYLPLINVRYVEAERAYYLYDDSEHPGKLALLTDYLTTHCYDSLFTLVTNQAATEMKVLEPHLPRFIDAVTSCKQPCNLDKALRKAYWRAHRSAELPEAPPPSHADYTPLYYAIQQRNFAGAMALLAKGDSIDGACEQEAKRNLLTAISTDAEATSESLIFLLEQGACPEDDAYRNAEVEDYTPFRALDFAIQARQNTNIKLLLLYAADKIRSYDYYSLIPNIPEAIKQSIAIAEDLVKHFTCAKRAFKAGNYADASEAYEKAASLISVLGANEADINVQRYYQIQELNCLFKALNCQERLATATNYAYQYALLNKLLMLAQQLAEPIFSLECMQKIERLLSNPVIPHELKKPLQALCQQNYSNAHAEQSLGQNNTPADLSVTKCPKRFFNATQLADAELLLNQKEFELAEEKSPSLQSP